MTAIVTAARRDPPPLRLGPRPVRECVLEVDDPIVVAAHGCEDDELVLERVDSGPDPQSGQERRALDIRAAPLGDGVAVVWRDVTAREEQGRALVEAEELFQAAFHGAPIGVALVSLDSSSVGRILLVNKALCDLLGYTADQLVAMTVLDVTHPDAVDQDRATLASLTEAPIELYRREKRYVHADCHPIWVQVAASPIHDSAGRPLHTYVSHIQDITARKQAETQLTFRALHDPLTGLGNRRLLLARLQVVSTVSTVSTAPTSPSPSPSCTSISTTSRLTTASGTGAATTFWQRSGAASGKLYDVSTPQPVSAATSSSSSPRCVPRRRRSVGTHRPHRRLGAPDGLPPTGRLAGRRRPTPRYVREPLGPPGPSGRLS